VSGSWRSAWLPAALRSAHISRELISPRHARTAAVFARLIDHLPPALAESYVLPWAGGTPKIDRLCRAVTSALTSPTGCLGSPPARPQDLSTLFHEAMRQAWQNAARPGGQMFEDAARRAVAELTGDNASDSLALLGSADPVDPILAARLLAAVASQPGAGPARDGQPGAHHWLPFLASTVRACGGHLRGRPAVPGIAVGRLVYQDPRKPALQRHEGAILLVDGALPAQTPLLLAARGVISRTGSPFPHQPAAGRRPGVPTVTGCDPEAVTGSHRADGSWLAAIDGSTGEVALLAP
jgi:PEP-utilising enzyme, mobile domain